MIDVEKVADDAELIVNGYAFSKCELGFKILNLYNPEKAIVLSNEGEMLETTMDGIEVSLVKKYFVKNKELLEVENA